MEFYVLGGLEFRVYSRVQGLVGFYGLRGAKGLGFTLGFRV